MPSKEPFISSTIDEARIAEKTRRRLRGSLYEGIRTPLFLAFLLSVAMFLVLLNSNGVMKASLWMFAITVVYIWRYLNAVSVTKIPDQDRNYPKALKTFRVGLICSCLVWSSVPIFFLDVTLNESGLIYVVIATGMVAAGITSLCSVLSMYLTFLVTLLAPIILYFIFRPGADVYSISMGSVVLLYLVFMYGSARRLHQRIWDSLFYEIAHEELAADLKTENSAKERLNEELKVAMGKAQSANEAKSSFLAVISHEIRTPMNGVLGMLDLMGDTELGEEQSEYRKTALKSARSLLRLLDDLLDFSKADRGALDLDVESFCLPDAVEEIAALMSSRATQKDLGFECVIHPDTPEYVMGDAGRLKQILANLLGNSMKFTLEGNVKIEVFKVDKLEDGNWYIRFRVFDTGIGIPAKAIDSLFQPFQQADSSLTRSFGGTGLGLAISRQLVEQMGGKISVTSEEGTGSTFEFSIRLGFSHGEDDVVEGIDDYDQSYQFTGNVLIVDDDSINQAVLKRILHNMGVNSEVCANGKDAITESIQDKWDLVLMDLQMPDLDGFEATRQIRDFEKTSGKTAVPIVALTANVGDDNRAKSIEAGMNDFACKPLSKKLVSEILSKWLPK